MWYEALAMLTPAACGRRRRREGGEGGVLPASPAPLRPLLGTALGGEPRPARDGGRRTGSAAGKSFNRDAMLNPTCKCGSAQKAFVVKSLLAKASQGVLMGSMFSIA